MPIHESADELEIPRITPVGVSVQVRPLEGEIDVVRTTEPVKPSRLFAVIVELPSVLASIVTLVGVAETVKSWTV